MQLLWYSFLLVQLNRVLCILVSRYGCGPFFNVGLWDFFHLFHHPPGEKSNSTLTVGLGVCSYSLIILQYSDRPCLFFIAKSVWSSGFSLLTNLATLVISSRSAAAVTDSNSLAVMSFGRRSLLYQTLFCSPSAVLKFCPVWSSCHTPVRWNWTKAARFWIN